MIYAQRDRASIKMGGRRREPAANGAMKSLPTKSEKEKLLTSSLGTASSASSFGRRLALATGSSRRSSANSLGVEGGGEAAAAAEAVALSLFFSAGIGKKSECEEVDDEHHLSFLSLRRRRRKKNAALSLSQTLFLVPLPTHQSSASSTPSCAAEQSW